MIKVLYDTQIFDWQINGGISRYFSEIIKRIDHTHDTEVLFKCSHSYNNYIKNTKWLKHRPVLQNWQFRGKLRIVKYLNQIVNRAYSNHCLQRETEDVFHPTYYDPYFLQHIGKKPFVLTVHDLTNEKFNDNTALTTKILQWKATLIEKASHIIAVSENTRQDIIQYYKISPELITTAYHASPFNDQFISQELTDNDVERYSPYILYVGSRKGYKNFSGFIHECGDIIRKQGLKLVIAGGGSLSMEEKKLIQKAALNDSVCALSHVSDYKLACLYKNAIVFVFPSIYEGFGIPAIEAMQFGCPVLLSNNSSLPEVGGEAAFYFDPFSKGDMQVQLQHLLQDEALRKYKSGAGKRQAKKFNWDNTADTHMNVYRKVIQHAQ